MVRVAGDPRLHSSLEQHACTEQNPTDSARPLTEKWNLLRNGQPKIYGEFKQIFLSKYITK